MIIFGKNKRTGKPVYVEPGLTGIGGSVLAFDRKNTWTAVIRGGSGGADGTHRHRVVQFSSCTLKPDVGPYVKNKYGDHMTFETSVKDYRVVASW